MSEWKSTIRILAEQPNFSMDLTRLGQELITRNTLGFSEDPSGHVENIVYNLEKQGYVTYNPETEVVMLLPAKIIKKFLAQMDARLPADIESPKIKSELTHEQEIALTHPALNEDDLRRLGERINNLKADKLRDS